MCINDFHDPTLQVNHKKNAILNVQVQAFVSSFVMHGLLRALSSMIMCTDGNILFFLSIWSVWSVYGMF